MPMPQRTYRATLTRAVGTASRGDVMARLELPRQCTKLPLGWILWQGASGGVGGGLGPHRPMLCGTGLARHGLDIWHGSVGAGARVLAHVRCKKCAGGAGHDMGRDIGRDGMAGTARDFWPRMRFGAGAWRM